MGTIHTLILSGGGGRGAFHAGVYQYLCQAKKPGLNDEHQGAWTPDIVVGTSIGAVNGAAIVQGMSSEELVKFWQSVREQDIEGLPPGMSFLARLVVNRVMKGMLGVNLPSTSQKESTSTHTHAAWEMLPNGGKFLNWLLGKWANVLDTGPLRKTITEKLSFDEGKINASSKMLLINATNVSTGRRTTFSNHPVFRNEKGEARRDVVPGINVQRILASCSIPMMYPWTYDDETRALYWDGALVNNTPIGVAVDAARDFSPNDDMEIVVVMMTPWREGGIDEDANAEVLPRNFSEAITWALDWALLASFRERLDLIDAYNRLGQLGRQMGDPVLSAYRNLHVTIVAPENFIPADRILNYDEWNNHLIVSGYRAAERAFRGQFAEKPGG